jgi:hypothetical protein
MATEVVAIGVEVDAAAHAIATGAVIRVEDTKYVCMLGNLSKRYAEK